MKLNSGILALLAGLLPAMASAAVVDCVEAESASGPAKLGGEYRVSVRPVEGARHELVLSQEYEGGAIVFFESQSAKVERSEARVAVSGGELKVVIDLGEDAEGKLRGQFAFETSDEPTPLVCEYRD